MSTTRGTGPAVVIEIRVEQVPYTDPAARLLEAEVQQEYVFRYGNPDATHMDPTQFEPPHGGFYVGFRGEEPVAMGGWRFRPDVSRLGSQHAAEVKRMYVAPTARRGGLARLMLTHLERAAQAAGADVVILETGTAQPEAIALYGSAGYQPIESFGHYYWSPSNRCFGRVLGPPVA